MPLETGDIKPLGVSPSVKLIEGNQIERTFKARFMVRGHGPFAVDATKEELEADAVRPKIRLFAEQIVQILDGTTGITKISLAPNASPEANSQPLLNVEFRAGSQGPFSILAPSVPILVEPTIQAVKQRQAAVLAILDLK